MPVLKKDMVPDMNLFTLEFTKNKSKTNELAEAIANDINTNKLKKNDKLPSKRALANHLGISLNTVINAYLLLLSEGYIYSIEKKGYFVSDNVLIKNTNPRLISNKDIKNDNYLFSFKTSNIDSTLIPTNTLKKIYNDILKDNNYFYKTDFSGETSLKEAICQYLYEVKGIQANIDDVIISSGIDTLILQIIKLTNANIIAIENPGYKKIETIIKYTEKRIVYQNIDNEGITIPNEAVDLIYTTPYSQFPLGIKMSNHRKNDLINYAKANKGYIIEDSFDSDFTLKPFITKALYSMSDSVFYIESFSRSISPSFRISFMLLPPKLSTKYKALHKGFSNPVSTIEQLVLAKYISTSFFSHINRLRVSLRKKRELIIETLDLSLFDILYDQSYLAIIVRPKYIPLNIKEILLSNKIDISFINDFMYNGKSDLIMIGYSEIAFDKIKEGIILLNNIFRRKRDA